MLACYVQALVRAYVRGSTADISGQEGLTDEELQAGLMAGFGARARRKHMQRHAASLAAKKEGAADASADMRVTHSNIANAAAASSPDENSIVSTKAGTDDVDREVSESGVLQVAERGVKSGMGKQAVSSSNISAGNQDEDQESADGFEDPEGVQDSAAEELTVRDFLAPFWVYPNQAGLAP